MVQRYLNDKVLAWTGGGMAGIPFSSFALRNEGVTVWIDAVDPGRGRDELIKVLGKPEHLLITFGDHDRDVLALAKEFGAEVWVPEGQAPEFRQPDHLFGDGDKLPAGLMAMAIPGVGYGECLLYGDVDDTRVGFFGDAVMNMQLNPIQRLLTLPILAQGKGPFQRKRSFRGGDTRLALQSIPKILDLNLDAAFFSHGVPAPHDAHRLLKESIETW